MYTPSNIYNAHTKANKRKTNKNKAICLAALGKQGSEDWRGCNHSRKDDSGEEIFPYEMDKTIAADRN